MSSLPIAIVSFVARLLGRPVILDRAAHGPGQLPIPEPVRQPVEAPGRDPASEDGRTPVNEDAHERADEGVPPQVPVPAPTPEELEAEAYRAYSEQPDDIGVVARLIRVLLDNGKPLPDVIHEHALRLQLAEKPFDQALTYSLVALLHRLGRPPIPEPPSEDEDAAVRVLLATAQRCAAGGDVFGVYAAHWQIVVRFPRSARGWAEYARAFAERAEWENCRIAAARALAFPCPAGGAAPAALLKALGILADHAKLDGLAWQPWLAGLDDETRNRADAVNLLLMTDQVDEAARRLPALIAAEPRGCEAALVACKTAYAAGRVDEAYDHLRRAVDVDAPAAVRAMIRDLGARTSRILEPLRKFDELADVLAERSGDYPEINLVPPFDAPESLLRARSQRRAALDRGLPSAMVVTLPKSGSVTVGNVFGSGYDLPNVIYSLVNGRVVLPWLEDFVRGGGCYTTHLEPSPTNIDLLVKGGAGRIIVHVRDPRQALISGIEHVRMYPRDFVPSVRGPRRNDPAGFLQSCLESYLPAAIAWIDGWARAQGRLNICVTTFEDMVADQDKFVDRIVDWYGGDRRHFDRRKATEMHEGIDYHRRLGKVDEWRSVLSPQQVARVNALMPDYFWDKFGWRP